MPAPRIIYAIGDSLIGNDAARSQPLFHLRSMFGQATYFKAQGIGGETSAQILVRLEPDVLNQIPKPDTCLVLGGVNDIQAGYPAAAIIANLGAIYRKLVHACVQPIAMSIYPFGGHATWTPDGERTRQEVLAWLRHRLPVELPEVEFVDVEDVIGDLRDPSRPRIRAEYVDAAGIHTSPAGAAAVAQALVERTRALARPQG